MDDKVKERFEAAEARLTALDQVTADLTTELRKLRARINVLERPETAQHGHPIDLDQPGSDVDALVTALSRAWEAEQAVLTDESLTELRRQTAEFEKLLSERSEITAAQSGRRFGRIDRGELDIRKKRIDWHISTRESDYDEASARLQAHEKTIQDPDFKQLMGIADEARTNLVAVARKRIEQALVSGKRMPVWFTVALGAPRSPDPAQWVNIGVGLLAYRLEYGVKDPISALGTKPSGSTDYVPWQRRTAAYDKLLAQLQDFYS